MPTAIVIALREDLKIEIARRKGSFARRGRRGRTAALKLASENVAELFLVNRTRAKGGGNRRAKSKGNFRP